VENSIRHAKLQEKKDGYIIVKTCLDIDNVIHIEIKDNGCGFDSYNIDTSKHSGIHNAVTRLKIALNANTEIISSPDKGTTVKITFIKRNADEVGINDVY